MGLHHNLFFRTKGISRGIYLLALVLAITGCQQKSQEAKGSVAEITLAYPLSTSGVLTHIALKNGYFAEAGLKVTAQIKTTGKAALDDLLEGKADFATAADTPIMFAITNGKKIYLIAEIQTSTQDEGIVARRDLGIIKPSDLKGKKIGVTLGTAADFFMDSFFLMHGINRQEVKIIDVNPEEMLEALRHGRVDAVSIWNPLLKQLQKELGDKGVVFLEEDISTTLFCFVVTYEFAKQNPKVIKKVLKALIKAEEFVMQHPEEAKKVIAEATQTEPAIIDDIWDGLTFKVTLDQSLLTSLEDQTRWAQKYGLTKGIEIHNYLDFIYFDGLQAVRPETVRIIR